MENWNNGEANGNSFQCSWLENPRDGGAWWAAVYGVAQSRTRLKRLSSSSIYPFRQFHHLIMSSHGCFLSSFPPSSVHIFLYTYTSAIYYMIILLLYFIIYSGQNMCILDSSVGNIRQTWLSLVKFLIYLMWICMYVCSYLFIYCLNHLKVSWRTWCNFTCKSFSTCQQEQGIFSCIARYSMISPKELNTDTILCNMQRLYSNFPSFPKSPPL